jgi:hypothetical protein
MTETPRAAMAAAIGDPNLPSPITATLAGPFRTFSIFYPPGPLNLNSIPGM